MNNLYPFETERSSLLGTEAFRNLLSESLKKAEKNVIILSAYISSTGIKWLIEQLKEKSIECTIITRCNEIDLAQGSTDIECYKLIKEKKWSLKILKDLHAKVILIDHNALFLGSPNLTGAGMNLVPASNKEIGIKTKALDKDLSIINEISGEATLVNDYIYDEITKWKASLPKTEKSKIPNFPITIKEKLNEKFNKLWVHNFPWSDIEYLLINYNKKDYTIEHDLQLFGIEKVNTSELEKKINENFLNSKVFNWLISTIKKREKMEMYFGEMSEIIHNNLLDDPKPYRQNVKLMQHNLLSYIKYFKPKNIEIDVPKKYSERIKINETS